MNRLRTTFSLLACCVYPTFATSASADFVGVSTVNKDNPDTEFLCTQGHGDNVPTPLTVCSVLAVFDDPDDVLISLGKADLQVYNGESPDVFYQHPLNTAVISPQCFFVEFVAPDLICDTYITIGVECGPGPFGSDQTTPDGDFDPGEFDSNGHVVGGWFSLEGGKNGAAGQGVAGHYPDLGVLFLQSSVAQGLSLTGDIDIFWSLFMDGDIVAEIGVPVECAASCGSCPTDTDGDGDTDADDLAVLLGGWGPVDAGECLDNDTSGSINAFDLAVLLGAWGPCE